MISLTVFCFTVSSGSVTVNADSSVQILAEEAHPLERFDAEVSWVKIFYTLHWHAYGIYCDCYGCKNDKVQVKNARYFSNFCSENVDCGIFIEPPPGGDSYIEAFLMNTHNLFYSMNKKNNINHIFSELIVYPWSGVRPSSVRPQCSNIFFSETAWPIKAKFYVEPSG